MHVLALYDTNNVFFSCEINDEKFNFLHFYWDACISDIGVNVRCLITSWCEITNCVFQIQSKIGRRVIVDVLPRGINVFIHLPASDKSLTSGLCGDYNGDSSDDIPLQYGNINTFIENWRSVTLLHSKTLIHNPYFSIHYDIILVPFVKTGSTFLTRTSMLALTKMMNSRLIPLVTPITTVVVRRVAWTAVLLIPARYNVGYRPWKTPPST